MTPVLGGTFDRLSHRGKPFLCARADRLNTPSDWVTRFSTWVPAGSQVLDLACGGGRHTKLFLERGLRVLAVDQDVSGIAEIFDHPGLEAMEIDLENGRQLPFARRKFGGVVVTNYLHRPLLESIVATVAVGGILIYETFAEGNEPFEGPSRPDFLLKPGELLEVVRGQLRVVAYEDLIVDDPRPAAMQRIAAVREPA